MNTKFVRLALIVAIFSVSTSTADTRRRNRPPSSFGREANGQRQDYGDFGQQSQNFQTEDDNQLQYGGLQHGDDDDDSIQQVSRDTENFSGFIKQRPTPTSSSQNRVDERTEPPKYRQPKYSSKPEAVTPKGSFTGLKKTIEGVDVYAFYGVPYGKPPVGKLRFRRPEPADKLNEPFDATRLPNACPQTVPEVFHGFPGESMWAPNTNISEDCLYLNIWVPASIFENRENELVPVLFWIYGGGFFSGSNSLDVYNGGVLAATQGLIVVSVQYRLGPLGFLYFGSDDAPGNVGLIDQSLGLRWTRENIEYFGGDSNSITAAGESCGSASVGFHLVSPLSKSFIKRGMMTSGLPNIKYSLKSPDELRARSFQLAKLAGCNQKDVQQIIECLRNVDSDELITLQWKLFKNILDFPFSPTVDGYFLPDHPDNLLKNGKAKRAELILGTVRDEGTYFILYHYLNYFSHVKPTSVPYDRYVDIMNELYNDYSEVDREAIIDQYTNWENPEEGYTNQKSIGDSIGDSWFICPHRKFADDWSNRGLSVYYYHFTERFSTNPWAKWMGVMHGDDIGLLFGAPFKDKSHTNEERNMSLKFMEMVGNFARVGVPSNNWERYTSEHPVYLDVNSTVVTDTSTRDLLGPRSRECSFWNKMLPTIRRIEAQCAAASQQQGLPFGGQNIPLSPAMTPDGARSPMGHQNGHLPPPPGYHHHPPPPVGEPMYCTPQSAYYAMPHHHYNYMPPPGPPPPQTQGCASVPQQDTHPTSCKCSIQEGETTQQVTPVPE